MKVAVVGAGFTGLSAALHLVKQETKVTVFEKEKVLETFKKLGLEENVRAENISIETWKKISLFLIET